MEDFQTAAWIADFEKISSSPFLSAMSFGGGRANGDDKQNELFKSPMMLAEKSIRNNLAMFESSNLMKDDDFALDSVDNLKVEHQEPTTHAYTHNATNQGQLDFFLEPTSYARLHDYPLDSFGIRRSRGPSFNFTYGRKGSEDFFNNSDLLRLFKNNQEQEVEPEKLNIKSEYDEDDHEEMQNTIYGFTHLMPGKAQRMDYKAEDDNADEDNDTHTAEETAAADESTFQHSGANSEHSGDLPSVEGEPIVTPKRKRKANTNVSDEPNSTPKGKTNKGLKIKKSKSENKTTVYAVGATKGQSLSLKLVRVQDPADAEQSPKIKIKKRSSKANKAADESEKETPVKFEETEENNQKDTLEMPPPIAGGVAKGPQMVRSNSEILASLFQGKPPGSLSDLVAGLGLPAEVEEMLNSSKIFSSLQSSLTKKIGTLTVEERRVKVERYLEKRKKRTWSKKINYDCRKRVADSRLRFKGRFVTKSQAFAMLAEVNIFPDPNKITEQEIKDLLEEKFGGDPVKKKDKEVDGRKNNGRPKKQVKLEENMQVKAEADEDDYDDLKSPEVSYDDDEEDY